MDTEVIGKSLDMPAVLDAKITTGTVENIRDEHFWVEYRQLWGRSELKCPFQAPTYLRNLADEREGIITGFCLRIGGRLSGIGVFCLEGKKLRFLSDLKSDQNNFVIDRNVPEGIVEGFFVSFLQEVHARSWKVLFHKCPSDSPNTQALASALSKSRLFHLRCDYAVCPVLAAADGASLYAVINRSKNQRFKVRRFVRRENLTFEVLTDEASLESWLTEFFQLHVLRWQRDGRYSKYRSAAARALLTNGLWAWTQDGVAVRFALKKGSRRLVMALALRQGESLIGNLQAFDPAHAKNSPGRAMLNYIGQWMADRNISRLNFGEGGDAYKYEYANEQQSLHTYFISKRSNLSYRVMAHFMTFCRHSPAIEWMMTHVRRFRQQTWKRANLNHGQA